MGKREQAREEAAFARGEVGVDGHATEEKRAAADVEKGKAREQFLRGKTYLGREFLTWLLWRTEGGEALLELEGEKVCALFGGRLSLRGIAGEVTELSVKGSEAAYSQIIRMAMDRGLLIHSARLLLTHGEKAYEVTLDAEFLDARAAKLPELMTDEQDDQLEERLFLAERLGAIVQALFEDFLRLRSGRRWAKEIVPEIKEWLGDPGTAGRSAA